MYCPNCGQENADSAKFCKNCGSSLAAFEAQYSEVTEAVIEQTSSSDVISEEIAAAQPTTDVSGMADVQAAAVTAPIPPELIVEAPPSPVEATPQVDSVTATYVVEPKIPPRAEDQTPPSSQGPSVPPAGVGSQQYSNQNVPPVGVGAQQNIGANVPPSGYGAPQNSGASVPPPNYGDRYAYTQQPYTAGALGTVPPNYNTKGCFGSAWSDLVKSPGWFGRVLLLSLINAIPILNFSAEGYAMDWGREVVFDRRQNLPGHFFGHRTMLLGLCMTVFSLMMSIFLAFCFLVSGIIPILGTIAVAVFSFFVAMFIQVGLIRMGVFGKFGAAFDMVANFRAYKRKLGSLFCASCLPGIVIGLITGAIVAILLSLSGFGALSNLSSAVSHLGYGYPYSSSYGLESLLGTGIATLILFVIIAIVCWYLIAIASSIIQLVTYRAMGYWVKRISPEWIADAYEEQKIYGVDFPAQPMLEEIKKNIK